MESLKVILIDSDPNIVKQISSFSEQNPVLISLCDFCDTLNDGFDLIKMYKPNLIIIDPTDENLFSIPLLKEMEFIMPKIIFISNEKNKAFEAFKYNAVDFLHKKFNSNDLIISLYKVLKIMEMETNFKSMKLQQLESFHYQNENYGFIAIPSSDKIDIIKIEEIIYCKAEGKYTLFFLENKQEILSSKNIGEYSPILLNNNFFRIHHSYIVNLKRIQKIIKKDGLYCELSYGILIPISKRRQEDFLKFLKL